MTDLRELITIEDLSGVTVVGHSMGGQIAQLLAASEPERIAAACLINPVPVSGLTLPDEARSLFRGSGVARENQSVILEMACKQLQASSKAHLVEDAGNVSAACLEQSFDAWTTGADVGALAATRATTLVVATDDDFLPRDHLRNTVLAHIPHSRLTHLPGPGHYPLVERPEETAAILDAFLAGTER